jgi:tetratricopeptide (TPR) repeat protein
MAGTRKGQARQVAASGRDAKVAGRDQINVNVGAAEKEAALPGLLLRDVPKFTGRERELDLLTRRAAGGSVVVTAIGGTAGVGKTALAVHAAHRLLPEFPDGHLYADLRGYTEGQDPVEPGEVLEVFLRRLGVPGEEMPAGTEERSGLLRQLLASRRVLMLLDNVRTEAQVRPLLPGAGGSLVLITSRAALAALDVDERIGLDVLPKGEATALLAALIGSVRAAAEPQAVEQVRDWCGRLPLALQIAGQFLATRPAWPVARLARMLSDERSRLDRLAAGDRQVRAAFTLSYRQLADGEARMFRLLGLHPGPDFGVLAAASLAGVEPETAESMLGRLTLAHLITEDAVDRFGMHDLLRLFARDTCHECDDQATRDAAEVRLVDHYGALARLLDTCIDPGRRAKKAAEPGLMALPTQRQALMNFQSERLNLLAILALAARHGLYQTVWTLSEDMGDAIRLLYQFDDLVAICTAAISAAREAKDAGAEARALANLGTTYLELARFEEALPYLQQVVTIFREIGPRQHEGHCLNLLGSTFQYLGRTEDAISCYRDSLKILREIGDRIGEGQTLNNLGNVYDSLGQFEEAVTCYEKDLAICQETDDRHGEAVSLDNLGNTYQRLMRFEIAVNFYGDALAIFQETGERHREGSTLDHVGAAYNKLRQRGQAARCWQEAAVAMRDAGDHEEAARLEHLATEAASRRRWRRPRLRR